MPHLQPGLQHARACPARHRPASGVDDFAGDVAAGDVRQRNAHPIDAAALPEIEMIQRAGAHANDGAPGCGYGIGRVFVAQHLGPAVLVEADCLHRRTEFNSDTLRHADVVDSPMPSA